mgnify:CR=1 FL=1
MRDLPINRDSAFITFVIATDIFVIIIVVDTCGNVTGGSCAHYQWHHCNSSVGNFNEEKKMFHYRTFCYSLAISGFYYAPRFLNIYAKKGKSEADFLINAWRGKKSTGWKRLIFIELWREVAQLFISFFFFCFGPIKIFHKALTYYKTIAIIIRKHWNM